MLDLCVQRWTLLSLSFLVGEAPTGVAVGGGPPGPAGTTAMTVGRPVPPGASGVMPRRFKQTLLKISTRDSSVGLSGLVTAAASSVAGVTSN